MQPIDACVTGLDVAADGFAIRDAEGRQYEAAAVILATAAVRRDGARADFDAVYVVFGSNAQSGLASGLGAKHDDNNELIVDRHQMTSVDRLFAIGDVVSAINQIAVGVGHAAVAATYIHNMLPASMR